MPWTTPKTWATNDSLGASTLNSHLRDNLNFLHGPPRCRVYNSSNGTLSTATATAITFNSERFDTDGMHSTSSNTSRITIQTAGTYLIGGSIIFAANGTGVREAYLRVNNSTVINYAYDGAPSASNVTILTPQTVYLLGASDYVELVGYQTSGGNLTVNATAAYGLEMWAVWLGS